MLKPNRFVISSLILISIPFLVLPWAISNTEFEHMHNLGFSVCFIEIGLIFGIVTIFIKNKRLERESIEGTKKE